MLGHRVENFLASQGGNIGDKHSVKNQLETWKILFMEHGNELKQDNWSNIMFNLDWSK